MYKNITIANKLILGFGIVSLMVIVSSVLTFLTLNANRQVNEKISDTYTPSVYLLTELHSMIDDSKMLIKNWVYIDEKNEAPDRIKLKELHTTRYMKIKEKLNNIVNKWETQEQYKLQRVFRLIEDSLLKKHKKIMGQSQRDFFSYANDFSIADAEKIAKEKVENYNQIIVISDKISEELLLLLNKYKKIGEQESIKMDNTFDYFQIVIVALGIVSLFIASITAFILIRSLTNPIVHIKNVLQSMSLGVLQKGNIKTGTGEIYEMSSNLNALTVGLKKTEEFALEIGKSNFDKPFSPMSDKDMLGNALLHMRDDLVKAANDEKKRKAEEIDRTWATSGIAKFSDILRLSYETINDLSYEVIRNLIKYVNANQGAVYLLNDADPDDKFLEVSALYAYDRKKFSNKRIEIGDGLVGANFIEKETAIITDIPNNYLSITSGLGEANPNCIIIVPLKYNDLVFGMIEMATFEPYTITQVEFIEKIAANVSSTISNLKINIRTADLLKDSQEKSEQLISQEEEMRQSLEEMQAIQEETEKKNEESIKLLDAVDRALYKMELTSDGKICSINDVFIDKLGMQFEKVTGNNINVFISDFEMEKINRILEKSKNEGLAQSFIDFTNYNGEIVKIFVILSPVFNVSGSAVEKILLLGFSDVSK